MPSFFRRSIMTKLLLIVGVATVLVNLAVFNSVRYLFKHTRFRPGYGRPMAQLARYLRQDLGDPPSMERAQRIGRELDLSFRWEGPAGDWSSAPDLPSWSELEPKARREPGGDSASGRIANRFFIELDTTLNGSPAKFIVFTKNGAGFDWVQKQLIALAIMLCLILGVSFVIIRRLFAPLAPLTAAVSEVSRGHFGLQVKVSAQDELGRLASAFNEMSARLSEIIRAKEQLLVDVSHELRSPIARAKVALELPPNDQAAREELGRDLDEMDYMVRELLESARLESGYGGLKKTEADLGALARDIVAQYSDRFPMLRLAPLPGRLAVSMDVERIRIVIRNLIENALKYSPPDKPVAVKLGEEPNRIVLEVEDHGPGIPAEELEKVFEPFYRVDKSRTRKTGGFGLGLSLCRKIMRAHRGDVLLRSTDGAGSTAVIWLPKA